MACIRPKNIEKCDMEKVVIYSLSCGNDIRYVGKTRSIGTMCNRYKNHVYEARKRTKNIFKWAWVRWCKKNGLSIDMEVIELCDQNNWEEREVYWIAQLKAWGFNLTNIAEGGRNFAYSSIKHFDKLGREAKEQGTKTTAEQREEIFKIAQEGELTYTQIGAMFGIRASSVNSILHNRGYIFKPSQNRINKRVKTAIENGKKLKGRKQSKDIIEQRLKTCRERGVDFGSKLNENDLDTIKKLYEEGCSMNKISKIFNVDPTTIEYRLKRMGVYKRKEVPEKKHISNEEEIIKRVSNGESYNKISKDYGCSHGTIRYIYLNFKTKKQCQIAQAEV